jgi:hypothetical protein
MRCPDCGKFVSQELQTPELESAEIDAQSVSVEVRVVLNCVECGTELKECRFNLDVEVPVCSDAGNAGHDTCVELEEVSETERSEGSGRYRVTFYGFESSFTVSCECGKSTPLEWAADEKASNFDELV